MSDFTENLPEVMPDQGGHMTLGLRDLADRARGYAEAASSGNTRKAYA